MSDWWELTIIFDDLETQAKVDGELHFPYDEANLVVSYISSEWDVLPEELEETVQWTDTRMHVGCDILDPLARVIEYALMHSVPKKVILRRNGERI